MTIEGDVTSFLCIELKHLPSGAVQMLQLGLIEQELKTTGMQHSIPDQMPVYQKPFVTEFQPKRALSNSNPNG